MNLQQQPKYDPLNSQKNALNATRVTVTGFSLINPFKCVNSSSLRHTKDSGWKSTTFVTHSGEIYLLMLIFFFSTEVKPCLPSIINPQCEHCTKSFLCLILADFVFWSASLIDFPECTDNIPEAGKQLILCIDGEPNKQKRRSKKDRARVLGKVEILIFLVVN